MNETKEEVLSRVFGFNEFRPNQEEIVSALLEKRDVFSVMPFPPISSTGFAWSLARSFL